MKLLSFRLIMPVVALVFFVFAPTGPVNAEAIHDAAEEGNINEVKRLLSEGADVNAKDNYGKTYLAYK